MPIDAADADAGYGNGACHYGDVARLPAAPRGAGEEPHSSRGLEPWSWGFAGFSGFCWPTWAWAPAAKPGLRMTSQPKTGEARVRVRLGTGLG
jgi:hypothetical protein